MSFPRLIYWSGLLGGWSAFVGWVCSELAFGRWLNEGYIGFALAVLMATLVAAAIGAGLSQASGLVSFRSQEQLVRLGLGLAGGFLGGFVGSLFGNLVYALLGNLPVIGFVGRVLGWAAMGAAVGVVEGVYDRSLKKTRNGLIGGVAGGFLGGLLFNPISFVIGSPMSSRALAFVLLGLFVGLCVGLVQVVLKEAWLSVEGGFRPGRQLILSQAETTMGTSEKASLIFIAYGAKGVEPVHVRIVRAPDGTYVLCDNGSRTGTGVNGKQLQAPAVLHNGDVIQFGVNRVRFNERYQRAAPAASSPVGLPLPAAVQELPIAFVFDAPVPAATAVLKPAVVPVAKPAVVTAPVAQAAAPPPMAAPPRPSPVAAACPVCGGRVFVTTTDSRRCKNCFTVVA